MEKKPKELTAREKEIIKIILEGAEEEWQIKYHN